MRYFAASEFIELISLIIVSCKWADFFVVFTYNYKLSSLYVIVQVKITCKVYFCFLFKFLSDI